MRKQVTRISVHQTSKVIASVYVLFVIIFAIPVGIYSLVKGDIFVGLSTILLTPILYWLLFYISHVIGCLFYNFIAKQMGGIEFDFRDSGIRQEEGMIMTQDMPPPPTTPISDKIDKL